MAVLLDTNVVSELMRKVPDSAVAVWAAGRPLEDPFFSAVGEAELRYGAAVLPAGRGRETLVSDIERILSEAFGESHAAVRQRHGERVRRHRRHALFRRPPRHDRRLPDSGNRSLPPHGDGDA